MTMLSMRSYIRFTMATAAFAGLAACADSGPSAPVTRGVTPANAPALDLSTRSWWGYRTATFTITSAGGTFDIGGGFYTLTIPANAVCSLSSSYGPGTWDSPCTTLGPGESIAITATYGFSNANPVVDFSPELRFNPTSQVTLSTTLYASVLTAFSSYFRNNPSALAFFGMYYVPSLGSSIVTDAATDPSLVTHVNLTTGIVWRRIKHFSGYSVATGLACDPSPNDPDCVEVPPVLDQQP
jgi:hypothetical protein